MSQISMKFPFAGTPDFKKLDNSNCSTLYVLVNYSGPQVTCETWSHLVLRLLCAHRLPSAVWVRNCEVIPHRILPHSLLTALSHNSSKIFLTKLLLFQSFLCFRTFSVPEPAPYNPFCRVPKLLEVLVSSSCLNCYKTTERERRHTFNFSLQIILPS